MRFCLICNELSGLTEKSSTWSNTSRQTHYDFVNCTIKTETESSEHIQNSVCKRSSYTPSNAVWNEKLKERRKKQNTAIHSQWCLTFIHVQIHAYLTHKHTRALTEEEQRKNLFENLNFTLNNTNDDDSWYTHTMLRAKCNLFIHSNHFEKNVLMCVFWCRSLHE